MSELLYVDSCECCDPVHYDDDQFVKRFDRDLNLLLVFALKFDYEGYLPDISTAVATCRKLGAWFRWVNLPETGLAPICSLEAADGTAEFLVSFGFSISPVDV